MKYLVSYSSSIKNYKSNFRFKFQIRIIEIRSFLHYGNKNQELVLSIIYSTVIHKIFKDIDHI